MVVLSVSLFIAFGSLFALPTPLAHFSFNGGAGEIKEVMSGAVFKLPASVKSLPGGVSGEYLSLKRQEDSYVPLGKEYGFTGDFSLSFWMRTPEGYRDSGSIILSRHLAGSYNGYFVMVNSEWGMGQTDKLMFYHSNATIVSKTSVNDGRWHHVGIVYRKTLGAELYIDGKFEGKSGPAEMWVPDVNFTLGALTFGRPSGSFGGDIDELSIFGQAISAQDMAGIAASPGWFSRDLTVLPNPATGSKLKITLRNGQVLTLPTSEILKMEFGD
jgi:hypothetical protein